MKLSIITVCLNSENTIISTLNSVLSQTYDDIEHIIVDGGSTDRTVEIINNYTHKNKKIILAKNSGIYDSMNIGIKESSGDIITILNSDDLYQNENTLEHISKIIKKNYDYSIFLGNVVYFKNSSFYNLYRYFKSDNFKRWHLKYGIMPPHPSSFIKKEVYKKFGYYNKSFQIASDFEMFLRLIYKNNLKFYKLKKIVVRMKMGGISGKNFRSYMISTTEIIKSFEINSIYTNLLLVLLRVPSKIGQYLLVSKKKLNDNFRLSKLQFGKKYTHDAFKIIKKVDGIPFNENFILSGLNLAFLGYHFKGDIKLHKDLYHWPDGIFAKTVFNNIDKMAGRELMSKIKLPNYINKIFVYGNLSERNKNYLIKRFNLPVTHNELPYGNVKLILNSITCKIPKNSVVFLTLPTPKQEQIALELAKINYNYKIFCIGASISLSSGEEKPVPKSLENFEFLWRLRSDTLRRIFRITESLFNFVKGKYFTKKLNKLNIYSID